MKVWLRYCHLVKEKVHHEQLVNAPKVTATLSQADRGPLNENQSEH
jgi:hypothetical protein